MGQIANMCGEDIFGKLLSEYGDDLMRLILAQKSKDVIREKFNELNVESDNQFNDFESHVNSTVDQKLQELSKTFQSAKSSVEKYIPGGISTLERMKGQSINEFSGYNKLETKINEIKSANLDTISNKKEEVIRDLNGKQNQMIDIIEAQRPKVPIYEEIPEVLKRDILRKGETEFKQQIASNRQNITRRLLHGFLPESFKMIGPFLAQVNPENSLAGLLQHAFAELAGGITSAGGGSSSGRFVQNITQFF